MERWKSKQNTVDFFNEKKCHDFGIFFKKKIEKIELLNILIFLNEKPENKWKYNLFNIFQIKKQKTNGNIAFLDIFQLKG